VTRRIFSPLFVLAAICLASVSLQAQEFKAPVAKMELEDGDSIVFLGDSITHQRLYTQYVEDFFYTRYPKKRLKFHNSGVGGARAWDALQRFDRDVAAYKPKYVTILLGMNDGTYVPYDEKTFRTYHADMTEIVNRIVKIGATPILMTPTMYDSRAARLNPRRRTSPPERLELYNSVLAYYGTWLREVAVENGHGFVDMYGPLNNLTLAERKKDPNFTLIKDSVHPDAPGQLVMAYAIIEDMGLRGGVSNIRIMPGAKGQLASPAQGGQVSKLTKTSDGLEFVWTANALPWVLPEEAAVGVKLLKLGHRASREGLEVHGLAPGRYELSIDGNAVGQYSSVQLARHIELQENAKTPQHQQAAQVAALNKERNEGPIKALRDDWRTFQQFARLKRQLASDADNADLKKQVASYPERLAGLEERIKKNEAAAMAIEDRLFEINQPQHREYVLKRMARPAKTK